MVNVETNAISWNKRKAAFMGRLVWSSPIHTMVRNDPKCLMILIMETYLRKLRCFGFVDIDMALPLYQTICLTILHHQEEFEAQRVWLAASNWPQTVYYSTVVNRFCILLAGHSSGYATTVLFLRPP